jgi:16S rRNA C967 or C1407 C5-methylase (RsmB/RsmF family)
MKQGKISPLTLDINTAVCLLKCEIFLSIKQEKVVYFTESDSTSENTDNVCRFVLKGTLEKLSPNREASTKKKRDAEPFTDTRSSGQTLLTVVYQVIKGLFYSSMAMKRNNPGRILVHFIFITSLNKY